MKMYFLLESRVRSHYQKNILTSNAKDKDFAKANLVLVMGAFVASRLDLSGHPVRGVDVTLRKEYSSIWMFKNRYSVPSSLNADSGLKSVLLHSSFQGASGTAHDSCQSVEHSRSPTILIQSCKCTACTSCSKDSEHTACTLYKETPHRRSIPVEKRYIFDLNI